MPLLRKKIRHDLNAFYSLSETCDGTLLICPMTGKVAGDPAQDVTIVDGLGGLSRDQKNLVLIFLYEHFAGFQAQGLVPADGEKLRRLGSSFVSFTNAALLYRTIIEMKANAHRVFGTTFTAKYVDFVLRHDQATSFSPL
jgi:hypothetical protein